MYKYLIIQTTNSVWIVNCFTIQLRGIHTNLDLKIPASQGQPAFFFHNNKIMAMYDWVVGDLLAARNLDDVREVVDKVWRAVQRMVYCIALAYMFLFLRHIFLFLQEINPLNKIN